MLDDFLHCAIIKETGAGFEGVGRSPGVTDMAACGCPAISGGYQARWHGILFRL